MKNQKPQLSLDELLKEDTSDMVPEKVEAMMRRQLEAFHERLPDNKTRRTPLFWRWLALPQRHSPAWAAAVILLVVGLATGLFVMGNHPAFAFAQVLEQIRAFRPYSCTQTFKTKGEADVSWRLSYWSLTRRRHEYANGAVYVYDLGSTPPRSLFLQPGMKLAVEEDYKAMDPTRDLDLLKTLSEIQTGSEERLGSKVIEGHQTFGFHIRQGGNDWTVWADARTRLPVRVELGHPRMGHTIIMSGFKFDEKFDEALFSTQAPAGYTVQKIANNQINATEQHLLEGLRAVAEFLGGEFPVSFDVETLHDLRKPNQPDAELKALATKIQHALRRIEILKLAEKVRDFTYQGGGVKLGDSHTPIVWWLPLETGKYHVIYGDLSVRDVAPGELPQAHRSAAAKSSAITDTFRPYSCTMTVVQNNGTSSSNRNMNLSLSRTRDVDPGGDIGILDASQKVVRFLELHPAQHKASLKIISRNGPMKNPDIVALVRQMQNGSEQDLGMRVINGRQARGFHAVMPGNDWQVWVDQETGLPLLIELAHVGQGRKIIISDFRFDEKFDESLFSTTPPPGFTLKQ